FSNTVSPAVVAATLQALEMLRSSTALRDTLEQNTLYFRRKMAEAGFDIRPGIHPIVPIILHEAELVQEMSRRLYDEGIYVIGFFYPVVPRGRARIRVQISAAHTRQHLDLAIAAFTKVGRQLGVLK
ncbi:aminotransferase class I/II-fold pyridoxal phosphate-dependent enzyme, partial [bacterium]|nr:aminotransferase class I/II-fold pyridoxal phosphate-dependent enzyme [bacterium]